MRLWLAVMVSVMSLAVLTGCNRGGCGRRPVGEVPETSPVDELRVQIADLKIEQGREAALVRMTELIRGPEQAEFKPHLTEWLLDEYLREDPVEAVQDAYLALAAEDEEFARLGYRRMMSVSVSTNAAQTVAWFEKILAAHVSTVMKAHVWKMRVHSYGEAGSIAPMAGRLGEVLALSDSAQIGAVLGSAVDLALQRRDDEGIAALVAAIRSQCADRDDLLGLAARSEAEVLLAHGELDAAETYLQKHADILGDAALSPLAVKVMKAASAAGSVELVDRVVTASLAGGEVRPRTRDAVVDSWIRMAVEDKNESVFVDRVGRALDGGCPPAHLFSSMQQGFYIGVSTTNSAIRDRCLQLLDRFAVSESLREQQLKSCRMMQLDGAFYTQNFKLAYEIVEGGVVGYDELWHVEMKDKIGAHLALQEGRPDDAIALFRKHMVRVEAWENVVVNPENGLQMTREAVMGFNEKRIGDIYAGMDGHADDAKAAYARAREWYAKALELLDPESGEHSAAAAELSEVPAVE
jgi:tetratricopeptide (TPR) repeat protein